jgi:hypothetical protein
VGDGLLQRDRSPGSQGGAMIPASTRSNLATAEDGDSQVPASVHDLAELYPHLPRTFLNQDAVRDGDQPVRIAA